MRGQRWWTSFRSSLLRRVRGGGCGYTYFAKKVMSQPIA